MVSAASSRSTGAERPVLAPDVLDAHDRRHDHRGPNDRGTYEADGVALGVRRLSIVDVAGGHQPVSNENGTIVGRSERRALQPRGAAPPSSQRPATRFRSGCDTDIIPHLYEHAGPAFAERLRGKFAIAVWDEPARRAVVARDRLGIKPLYYARSGDLLVFASELKSLLASGLVDTDLDYEAIDVYLDARLLPGPADTARRRLEAAARAPARDRGRRCPRRAVLGLPEARAGSGGPPSTTGREGLLELLDESVRLRLMSDVPLGAMLSGGLDSSLIVALMARHMSEPVKTFAIGFAEAGDDNELADARSSSRALRDGPSRARALLRQRHRRSRASSSGTWTSRSPISPRSDFTLCPRWPRKHVTVALSGQGADELLRWLHASTPPRLRRLRRPADRGHAAALGKLGRHGSRAHPPHGRRARRSRTRLIACLPPAAG